MLRHDVVKLHQFAGDSSVKRLNISCYDITLPQVVHYKEHAVQDELENILRLAKSQYERSMLNLQAKGYLYVDERQHKDLAEVVEKAMSLSSSPEFRSRCSAFLAELNKSGMISRPFPIKRASHRI